MPERYVVRYGAMRHLGEFEPRFEEPLPRGTRVALQTERGTEAGDVLCPATDRTAEYLKNPPRGHILRMLNQEDLEKLDRLREVQRREFEIGLHMIQQRRLQMELIDVEHLLGDERIVFYFVVPPPEKRVDFRELVRDLAREFHTRIEMRQIGIRDEAKLLADYGDCGKPVCCNTHMVEMPPVSMRMAKLQKSTLDPSKISGRCGRLKCCLRFEHHVYEELVQQLPPVGSRILTRKGQGKVLGQEILAQRLLVQFEDGRRMLVDRDEVLSRLGK